MRFRRPLVHVLSLGLAASVLGTSPATASTHTAIHDVQGGGASAATPGAVTVQGVVTSLMEDDDVLEGFFVQEEDADADADPSTSEGIYVLCDADCPPAVAEGDLVTVSGDAEESFGMTIIDARGGAVTIDASGQPLPTAVEVTLPAAGSTRDAATFEALEGMVVTFPGTLVVTEYWDYARFGHVLLTADERPSQFTQTNLPDADGYAEHQADLRTRQIYLDDDNNDNNDAISHGPDEPYPYPEPGLSVIDPLRGGQTITGLTGVMHWSWAGGGGTDAWRIRPIASQDYVFADPSPRTTTPGGVGGDLTVASLNVLNYFTTIDDGTTKCPDDSVSTADLGCRGADSDAELVRQRDKIVAAVTAMDADVVGLVELENASGVIADLVDALNGATAPGTWAGIETGPIGPDVIRVGLVYQPASVTPVGDPAVLDDDAFVKAGTELPRNRAALAQTFADVDGAEFTVAVNHFKSKSGSEYDDVDGRCADGDPTNDTLDCDQDDGQAYFNAARTTAAEELSAWLATDPTGSGDRDALIVGDLNAYRMEDPIRALVKDGWTDLVDTYVGEDAYSYLFGAQLGTLDHALANASLASQVTGTTIWHINTDEQPLFDYNDDVVDATESWFERESSALDLYAADPYRSSDHDPVIVGLSLDAPPVADAGGPYTGGTAADVTLDASASTDPEGDDLTFAWDLDDDGEFDDAAGPTVTFDTTVGAGTHAVAVRVSDPAGGTSVAATTVEVSLEEVPFTRLEGRTRLLTAVEISQATYPDGAGTAVLAVSTRYPDALAAAPLAAQLGAPILLTAGDELEQATADELERLGVDRVVIVGGPAAISQELQDALASEYDVERVWGPERYATAAAIAERVAASLPDGAFVRAYVAQGQPRADQDPQDGWQDALTAAPVAAFHRAIVLLTPSGELAEPTASALSDLGVGEAIVIGGPTAVSATVYEAIDDIVGDTERVSGPNRYATSVAVARWAQTIGASSGRTWIATGTAFPDALVAGPAVAAAGGILLLVDGQNASAYAGSAAEAWLEEHREQIARAVVVGGTAAVSEAVREAIAASLAR